MGRTRTASAGVGAAGAFDAGVEGALPVRLDDLGVIATEKTRTRRSWLGIGLRVIRDAAVAVAFMTLVPIAIVALKGDNTWGHGNFGENVRAKLAFSQRYRSLALPQDPSITPMQAGEAFNALQPWGVDAPAFPLLAPVRLPEHSWESATLTPDMFVNSTMNLGFQGPSAYAVMEIANRNGLTSKETAYLRTLATAPVWREFDLVARAPAVDIIGGSFKLPFPANTGLTRMPTTYKATRALAFAAVSRAAYQLSIGQRDSAEMVLRSIVSFGFVMMDNGHTAMDEIFGTIIAGIGREALGRYYRLTNDPRATLPSLAPIPKATGAEKARLSVDEMRKFLIAETANPSEALGIRYEALRLLSAASCTNVKELMFGNNDDVSAAIANARTGLARYPSERAMVDLVAQLRQPGMDDIKYTPFDALAVSSATVAGIVLRNPRLAACTRIVTGYYGGPW